MDDEIIGIYRGTNIANDGDLWVYIINIFRNSDDNLEAVVYCEADTTNNKSSRPGPGAWSSSVEYDANAKTYTIRFGKWVVNPGGWTQETYSDCVLSDDKSIITCLQSATTWTTNKSYEFHRIPDSETMFNYLQPIIKEGSIHFDKWNSNQHKGEFVDGNGTKYNGVGMYVANGGSGTVYVSYHLIPANSTNFSTDISLDGKWCGTTAYGTSTFEILIDEKIVFTKNYNETFSVESVNVEIPQDAILITLRVQQNSGSRGNHACFFGIPNFE